MCYVNSSDRPGQPLLTVTGTEGGRKKNVPDQDPAISPSTTPSACKPPWNRHAMDTCHPDGLRFKKALK